MKKIFCILALCAAFASCKKVDPTLEVNLEMAESYVSVPGVKYEIPCNVFSGTGSFTMEFNSNENIRMVDFFPDDEENPQIGKIIFYLAKELVAENTALGITVANGYNSERFNVVFENEAVEVPAGDDLKINATAQGGTSVINFATNTSFILEIPSAAKSWISQAASTKALVEKSVAIEIKPNTGFERSAELILKNKTGNISFTYTVSQEGAPGVLKFVSTSKIIKAPVFTGSGVESRLFWPGEQKYVTMVPTVTYSKKYDDGAASHEVRIEAVNVGTFKFAELTGLTEIDITEL